MRLFYQGKDKNLLNRDEKIGFERIYI